MAVTDTDAATSVRGATSREASAGNSGHGIEIVLTGATLVLLLGARLADALHLPAWLVLLLNLGAYAAGGSIALVNTLPKVFRGDLDVDLLMVLAAIGAAAIGHWTEGAILLFLFSLSNTLQSYAMDRSRRAVQGLIKQRPTEASVLRNGEEVLVPLAELKVGDVVLLRPGQMAPADAIVAAGDSEMDESSITGESRMVPKTVGEMVFAGAINSTGALECETTRLPEDSTLARILRMIESAQGQKAQTQRVLERFEKYYAWTILTGTLLLILIPLALGAAMAPTLYRAMTLLVVASPCALIISTPAAILSAIARAAREGVLFKGGVYLEKLAEVRAVVFDKTGTLTTGKPGLTDILLAEDAPPDFTQDRLLAYAAAIESRSEHVLAKEVLLAAEARGLTLPALEHFVALPGRGLHAEMEGFQVWLGGGRLFEEHGEAIPADLEAARNRFEQEGKTVLILHRELARHENVGVHEARGGWLGLIAMSDTMRADVPETVAALKRIGIKRIVMLTGDNEVAAQAIAREAGITEVHAALLPEEKVLRIQELERQYGAVMMVGDGVNDAPALAHAAVGVAMGAAGSDLALESAPCVLMGEELRRVVFALRLSRRALAIIKVNLAFSVAVIAVLAASVFLFSIPLPLGVVGHEGSTLLVCLNGLRLLRMR